MHIGSLLGIFTTLLTVVNSQSSQDALKGLPECVVNCTLPVVVGLPCNITTLSQLSLCLCPNITAQHALSACVQDSCSFHDQKLGTFGNQQLCANIPIESRQAHITIIAIVVTALTLPFIMLRAWSRWIIAKHFAADDWAIIVASGLILASMGLDLKMTEGGFGRHIWTVNLDNLPQILKIFYSVSILYAATQGVTKISICLFYLRVFPQRWFQIATKCTIAFIAASCTAFIFLIAFECTPPSAFWDRNLPTKCIDQNAMSYSGAASSILQHIIILLLPIPCISSLQLGRGKKLSLFVMFGLGIFALITSLIRVKYIVGFGSTKDVTWDNSNIQIWSVIELAVAFICACLPALRPLLLRYAPGLFSSVKSRYGPSSRLPNGSRSNGVITVSSAFDVTRSRVRSGHIELEDIESRAESDDTKGTQGPHSVTSVVSQGRKQSQTAWSIGSEDTELVGGRRLDTAKR